MMTLSEFLHMGGYAPYVWSAYALALAILSLNVVTPLRRERALKRELARRARFQEWSGP